MTVALIPLVASLNAAFLAAALAQRAWTKRAWSGLYAAAYLAIGAAAVSLITLGHTRDGRPEDQQITGFGDYGYLWQIDRPGARRYSGLTTREPFYIASGNRGHVMMVFPYLDLVIAHQVATEGGVSIEAQIRRSTEGSPEVSDQQIEALFAAIIAAHPDGATAFEYGE